MGKIRILTWEGDTSLTWDPERVKTGDPEALAAVQEAERIFREQLDRGATAFQVEQGAPTRKLDLFDQEAGQVIVVPRLVGG